MNQESTQKSPELPTFPPQSFNPSETLYQPPQYVGQSYPPQPYPKIIYGKQPQVVVCPFCHQRGTTVTQKDLGFAAWLVAGGLCFLGCICCAPVALCVDSLKDTQHMCPNCKAIIGENKMIK